MAKKILAVDDSKTMRDMVTFTLRKAGFDVMEAIDGQKALDAMTGSKFDLIITDINMPDINGLELIRFVRTNGHLATVALLVISTQSSERDRARSIQLGADDFLAKPFSPDQLLEAVGRCRAARKSRGEGAGEGREGER